MEDQSKCSTTESISQNRNRLTIQKFHLTEIQRKRARKTKAGGRAETNRETQRQYVVE